MDGFESLDDIGALQDPGQSGGVEQLPDRLTRISSNNLYSAHFMPAGPLAPQRFPLFTVNLNGAGQGFARMTALETNLRSSGRVPDGESWTISALGIGSRVDADPADVIAFLANTVLVKSKRTMEEPVGPCWMWPIGAGISGFATTTFPAAQFIYAQNGAPAVGAMQQLPQPIELASGETFAFFLDLVNPIVLAQPFVVYCRLFGRFAEAVPS